METYQTPGKVIAPSDDLRNKEKAAAHTAVEHLQNALGKMTDIRDRGGRKDEVKEKAKEAYADAQKAKEAIEYVHTIRRNQP